MSQAQANVWLSGVICCSVACLVNLVSSQKLTVRIGHLGYETLGAGRLLAYAAFQRLYEDQILPRSITFSYNYRSLPGATCNEYNGIGNAVDLYINNAVDVYIGPYCNPAMPAVAQYAAYLNKPVIGYLNSDPNFENKKLYPTMSRNYPSQDKLSPAFAEIMRHFGWERAALIRLPQGGQCDEANTAVIVAHDEGLINVVVDVSLTFLNDTAEMDAALNTIFQNARIIFMCLVYKIGESGLVTTRDVLISAHQRGMTAPGFIYILPNTLSTFSFKVDPWLSNPNDGLDDIARQAFLSSIFVVLDGTDRSIVDDIDKLFQPYNATIWFSTIFNNVTYSISWPVQFVADAVYLYGLALNKSYTNDTYDLAGTKLFQNMKCIQFKAFTGDVQMNANADRLAQYKLSTLDFNGTISPFALLRPDFELACRNNTTAFIMDMIDIPNWRTKGNAIPLDTPVCGFLEERCQTDWSWNRPVLTVLVIVSFIAITIFLWWYSELAVTRRACGGFLLRLRPSASEYPFGSAVTVLYLQKLIGRLLSRSQSISLSLDATET